jgi:hypothetical protein
MEVVDSGTRQNAGLTQRAYALDAALVRADKGRLLISPVK